MNKKVLVGVEKANVFLASVAVLVSLYGRSFKLTFSIFLGFFIVAINFWFLKKIIFDLMDSKSNKVRLAVMLGIKYVMLLGLLGISIVYFNLHLVGLLVGISTLVIAIIWNTVLLGIK